MGRHEEQEGIAQRLRGGDRPSWKQYATLPANSFFVLFRPVIMLVPRYLRYKPGISSAVRRYLGMIASTLGSSERIGAGLFDRHQLFRMLIAGLPLMLMLVLLPSGSHLLTSQHQNPT